MKSVNLAFHLVIGGISFWKINQAGKMNGVDCMYSCCKIEVVHLTELCGLILFRFLRHKIDGSPNASCGNVNSTERLCIELFVWPLLFLMDA